MLTLRDWASIFRVWSTLLLSIGVDPFPTDAVSAFRDSAGSFVEAQVPLAADLPLVYRASLDLGTQQEIFAFTLQADADDAGTMKDLIAALDAVIKLDPRQMARNPVMFVVEVGSDGLKTSEIATRAGVTRLRTLAYFDPLVALPNRSAAIETPVPELEEPVPQLALGQDVRFAVLV